MIKHTKIFSADREVQEVVWIRREDEFEDNQRKKKKILRFKTEAEIAEYQQELQQHKDNDKLPIVYSPEYAPHFAKLEKLHPFDAHKGKHVAKVGGWYLFANLVYFQLCLYVICVFSFDKAFNGKAAAAARKIL